MHTELEDHQSRFHDIGGDNVYTANSQHVGTTVEGRLQEARGELAEMTSVIAEVRGYLKESKSNSGDEIEQLEETYARSTMLKTPSLAVPKATLARLKLRVVLNDGDTNQTSKYDI